MKLHDLEQRVPRRIIPVLNFLVMTLVVAAAGVNEPRRLGLTVGSELDYPPFALGKSDGSADGFTVDLWKATAKEMNLEFTIKVGPFHQILQDFREGKIDVLINLAYSEERARFADFSVPHVRAYGSIFVRKGDRAIRSESDLVGKSVLVLNEDLAHHYAISRGLEKYLVPVPDTAQAMKLLSAGQHDAVLVAKLVGLQTLRELGIKNVTTAGPPVNDLVQKFGFAVRKGNTELLAKINEGLAIMKANGTYDSLYEKWFGLLEPKGVTLAQAIRFVGPPLLVIAIILVAYARQNQLLRRLAKSSDTLRQSEAMLGQAQRLAHLGNWSFETKSRKAEWSEETFRIFGRDSATFVPTYEGFLDAVSSEDRPRIEQLIRAALTNGQSFDTEHRIRWPSGETRWTHSKGQVLADSSGQVFRLYGTIMDVTERRLAEGEKQAMEAKLQQAQKMESLGVLAGGIAHDFNNLLTAILCNASLTRTGLPSGDAVQPYLEAIELASQRAADLCSQMLAYSGKGRFATQPLDIGALIEETTKLLQHSIGKEITVRLDLAPKLPPILADATQIRQVLMNLIINSSEAIGDRLGTITLSTSVHRPSRTELTETYLAPDLPEGTYVVLKVSDTGCGMSQEIQPRIFEPFFTTKFTGRGLGLSAVLGIIRGHGGALKLESALGLGTTFTLLFPRTEGEAKPVKPLAKSSLVWRGQGTVLAVDDEEQLRNLLANCLRLWGFEVLLAGSGHEAINLFQLHADRITLVLLDFTMPLMDGAETFREIYAIRSNTPIILMSGYDERVATNEFGNVSPAGFLKKPFTPEVLRGKLQSVLESSGS